MARLYHVVLIFSIVLGIANSHPFHKSAGIGSKAELAYNARVVKCPDKASDCPTNHTCCLSSDGGYGCCAGLKAVCCDDKLHCCPENYKCDIPKGMCKRTRSMLKMYTHKNSYLKIPLLPFNTSNSSPKKVTCKDGKTSCPDKNTCCSLETGTYGCCAAPQAICCSDDIFCCPHGHACIPNSNKCERGGFNTPMLTELPAIPVDDELCPDKVTECGKNNTCCEVLGEKWGCCPVPKAVCCSNSSYCCPENTICDVQNHTCKTTDLPIKILNPSRMKIIDSSRSNSLVKIGSNVCPDEESECKNAQTCCLLSEGKWGCCPGMAASCCQDGKHCCNHGFTCTTNGQCIQKKDQLIKDLL